jgi:hypothetical protein
MDTYIVGGLRRLVNRNTGGAAHDIGGTPEILAELDSVSRI